MEALRDGQKPQAVNNSKILSSQVKQGDPANKHNDYKRDPEQSNHGQSKRDDPNLIEALLKPVEIVNYIPNQLLKKKKQKKKSKGLHL
jgi:hypothetical protein